MRADDCGRGDSGDSFGARGGRRVVGGPSSTMSSYQPLNKYCEIQREYGGLGWELPANLFDETAGNRAEGGMLCPTYAKFLGAMGATASMSFSGVHNFGGASHPAPHAPLLLIAEPSRPAAVRVGMSTSPTAT